MFEVFDDRPVFHERKNKVYAVMGGVNPEDGENMGMVERLPYDSFMQESLSTNVRIIVVGCDGALTAGELTLVSSVSSIPCLV